MPHITLIYPFLAMAEFPVLCETLAAVCNRLAPFEITLATFRFFEHSQRSCTIWLAPEPPVAVVDLQTRLWQLVPDCSEVRDFPGGFTPHLSVGQAPGRKAALERVKEWQDSSWRPLKFEVFVISLLARNDPPDDVFRIEAVISLRG